jgi:CheY-like chemotaxis protein
VATVLVVDDEPDVRLVARLVLEAAGFEVTEAESGEDALGAIEGGSAPDVILLDVRMSGIDGWEVMRRLRSDPAQADVPVVVFTANLAGRSDAPADMRDHDQLIIKPFNTDELLGMVEAALAR